MFDPVVKIDVEMLEQGKQLFSAGFCFRFVLLVGRSAEPPCWEASVAVFDDVQLSFDAMLSVG